MLIIDKGDTPAMDENLKTLFARITVHEFLLEVIFANYIADKEDSETFFEDFREQFMEKLRDPKLHVVGEPDAETVAVYHEATKIGDHFFDKIEDRLDSVVRARALEVTGDN